MKGRPAPAPGLLRRLDAFARGSLPAAMTIALLVLAATPVGVPALVPAAALPCVFFWSVFRPGAMPPLLVFTLGLLQDLLGSAPLGAGVLILLIAHGLAMRWRRPLARQSFLLVWLGFCGFALGAAALGWALQALLGWQRPPLVPAAVQVLVSVGLYPILAAPMTRMHEVMRRAEAAA